MANIYISSKRWALVPVWGGLQNMLTSSDDFSTWTASATTVSVNTTANSVGAVTADTNTESATTALHSLQSPNFTCVLNAVYFGCVEVKAGTASLVQLTWGATTILGSGYANFDLSSSKVMAFDGTEGHGIESLGGGWYRCWIAAKCILAGGASFTVARINAATAARLPSYTGTSLTLFTGRAQVQSGGLGNFVGTTGAATTPAGSFAASLGNLITQRTPLYGTERVFRCTTAGTSGAAEPAAANGNPWNLGLNATTQDGTIVWTECTGQEAYQGSSGWAAPWARVFPAISSTSAWWYPDFANNPVTISAGGSGYVVGNVVQTSGGTAYEAAVFRVATVSGGAVTSLTTLNAGAYSSIPGNPVASTAITGTGSGLTFSRNGTTSHGLSTSGADVYYIDGDHVEITNQAASLITQGGSGVATPFLSVDASGAVPPTTAKTGALLGTSGAFVLSIISQPAAAYYEGITFNGSSGSGANGILFPPTASFGFKNCAFVLSQTGNATIGPTNTSSGVSWLRFDNVTLKFGGVGQGFTTGALDLLWRGGGIDATGSAPTPLFSNGGAAGVVLVEGVDLSLLGAGKTLVAAMSRLVKMTFKDCKLGASVTVSASPHTAVSPVIDLVRCDSGTVNSRFERANLYGVQTIETTIVRTGGASDGTTAHAWKIVTSASSRLASPYEAPGLALWNETVGSAITLTVEGIWTSGTVPNADDIWMDVAYLGDATAPRDLIATCGKASFVATSTALPTSAAAWGGGTGAFKLQVTVTPQIKGPITAYVKAAKASTTFYVDPAVTVT